MKKNNGLSVPDGYFASLEGRLMEIPAQEISAARRGVRVLAPYLAYAASLAVLVGIGSFILSRTASGVSDEDIRSYLLASNTSVEQIYSVLYEEDF